MTTVLVDADGCPVVDLIIKIAMEFSLPVVLVCDTSHQIQRQGAQTVVVSKGADAVDFVLVNRLEKGDVVVTQDYGLAAMVLAKRCYVMDQNGRMYTNENIDQLLNSRHLARKVRQAGGRMKGPKKRQKIDNENFELNFRLLIMKAIS